MPELPEVERGRHMAEVGLAGKRIAHVEIAEDAIRITSRDHVVDVTSRDYFISNSRTTTKHAPTEKGGP